MNFRRAAVVFASNTAAGAIPAAMWLLLRPQTPWSELWMQFLYGCLYSHTIGTMAWIVLGRIACRLESYAGLARYAIIAAVLLALAVTGTVLDTLLLWAFGVMSMNQFLRVLATGLRFSIAITLFMGAIVTVYKSLSFRLRTTTRALRDRQLAEERARKLATEARLSSLESRIHPHFLFNTLNSITALIREEPARAERTVERLAALLRYSLDSNARGLVPLRQEQRIVQDYLEIEKTRFGDRLRYTFDVPPELEDLDVPPLALQTLVENSIKHAVSASRPGGEIAITARLGGGCLRLEVIDDGPGFDLNSIPRGHGLDNLQERLAALFPGERRLSVARRDGRTVVELAIPQSRVLV